MVNIAHGSQNKRLLVLPAISIGYFLVSVVILLAVALLVDKVLLPALEDRGKVVCPPWHTDNNRLYTFMSQRNQASKDNPVWRSAAYPVAESPSAGKKRILVMGDSYVWGDGYPNMNDIWWRQLQMELERRGYHNVEVISAGLCGAATQRELRWANKLVKQYKPDMLIWGYVSNDPEEGSDMSGQGIVKQIKLPKDELLENTWTALGNVFPNLAQQLSALQSRNLTLKYSGPKYGYDYSTWENKILEGENFESYKQTIKRMGKFVNDSTIPSTVVTLCMGADSGHKIERVEKLFVAAGVDFHNLAATAMVPWYQHLTSIGVLNGPFALAVNPANGHPNVTLTHFYAKQTADILEKSYRQVLGEKTPNSQAKDSGAIHINDFVPADLGVSNPKYNIFGFYYPTKDDDFLFMPFRRPYIQLDLSRSAALKEVRVAGKNLKSCSLALRSQDPTFPDEEVVTIHDLGAKKGSGCTFKMPHDRWSTAVDEIMVTASIDGPDRLVLVELVPQ